MQENPQGLEGMEDPERTAGMSKVRNKYGEGTWDFYALDQIDSNKKFGMNYSLARKTDFAHAKRWNGVCTKRSLLNG